MRSIYSCLPTTWQVTRSGACRYRNLRRKANAEHFYMHSDDMAGDAKRRVPTPKFKEEGKCGAFFTCLPTKCP